MRAEDSCVALCTDHHLESPEDQVDWKARALAAEQHLLAAERKLESLKPSDIRLQQHPNIPDAVDHPGLVDQNGKKVPLDQDGHLMDPGYFPHRLVKSLATRNPTYIVCTNKPVAFHVQLVSQSGEALNPGLFNGFRFVIDVVCAHTHEKLESRDSELNQEIFRGADNEELDAVREQRMTNGRLSWSLRFPYTSKLMLGIKTRDMNRLLVRFHVRCTEPLSPRHIESIPDFYSVPFVVMHRTFVTSRSAKKRRKDAETRDS